MPRPLKEINDEDIDKYETQMEIAENTNDKLKLKQVKRLFMEYIRKRNLTLRDFKEHPISQYFLRKKETKMKPEKLLLKRFTQREYRKRMSIIDRVKKEYDSNTTKIIDDYLKRKCEYLKVVKTLELQNIPKEGIEKILAYEDFGLDKIDKKFLEIIEKYETEYNERLNAKNKNLNRIRLYVIKRASEDYGDYVIDWINAYFNNDLDNTKDDSGIEDIIYYVNEYNHRYRNIEEKHFYIMEKINEVFNKDYTDLMLDYFNNEIQVDKTIKKKVLEEIKMYVSKYENEYNIKNGLLKKKVSKKKTKK